MLSGAPAGSPPAGFDPAGVGRLTRSRHGRVTQARVTMPAGLDRRDRQLYATSGNIASFPGIPNAGRLVRVDDRAFR